MYTLFKLFEFLNAERAANIHYFVNITSFTDFCIGNFNKYQPIYYPVKTRCTPNLHLHYKTNIIFFSHIFITKCYFSIQFIANFMQKWHMFKNLIDLYFYNMFYNFFRNLYNILVIRTPMNCFNFFLEER